MPYADYEKTKANARANYWANREKRLEQVGVRVDRKRKEYQELISGLMCVECGATGTKLHWHHRDPTTKTTQVSYLTTCREERLQEEIEKCDLLCVKCHHGRHGYEERRNKTNGQYCTVA